MVSSRASAVAGGIARISVLAFPALMPGCSGAKSTAPHPVVIDIPRPAFPAPVSEKPMAKGQAHARTRLQTVLNVSSYDDKTLEARLSVMRPDNSLERVILDPKVTFYSLAPSGWEAIPGCSGVVECPIPAPALAAKDGKFQFKAAFKPAPEETLRPSTSSPFVWEPGLSERTVF